MGSAEPDEGQDRGDDAGEAGGFTAEERAAMKERAAELKASRRRGGSKADKAAEEAAAVVAALEALPEPDRGLGQRLHALITEAAPDLAPRTWYGMPAYAKDGKVLCFFQPASKFKARYATLGFNDVAVLDEGTTWPVTWAITSLTAADEERVTALVRRAVG
ncbi:iron chaperone [Cellulomonas marina]|uniref:Uncharacterized conserved protein YdhG, YjbR/CyaY-like superfamily, DUF1801 family n=1 Tax=Cellulomonas marina TaxID=988821 RepID=A0A1I1AM66_9CELL|nr:DUF1801 domain-containing protein [Cellulomonas marina]GIG30780.1 hypothetical protein Cma02nite_33800 [Cellulomonas marina]SFB37423.1 Uncharacterized conserved protein YdhG, YjbR/CyaY-like superfamily, DUF1801 family [Cellulomonas marina]